MATEQIPTTLIADDAVTGAKIENNPTVAGNLTVSGTTTATGAFTASGGITAGTIGSSVVFPAGHIIQVTQTVKTSAFTMAANSNEQPITGYNCSITPHKTGSKILVNYSFDTSASIDTTARTYIERDIGGGGYSNLTGMMGDDPGGVNGPEPSLSHGGGTETWLMHKHAGMYLDSPSYSSGNAITYRIGIQSEGSGQTLVVGKTWRDNSKYHPRTASILILMEVAQ